MMEAKLVDVKLSELLTFSEMPGVEFCCQGPVEGKTLESVESESISCVTKK